VEKMTVRRGMAYYRQAGAGGILFMGLLQAQGQSMTRLERRNLYEGLFYNAAAKIEEDLKLSKLVDIHMLITEVNEHIEQAGKDYLDIYDTSESPQDLKNNYDKLLRIVLEKLWRIAIKARLIESIIDDEKVIMA
jgi:hypothetical protein